ncbi:fructosamine kinase family protein [Methylobacter tundripaludum]|uniref:Fructosamine/Ketosamine-3-kinase n=1 Tax=Methylobacter tundripaludum (strain ATCC BAA-1195 / DSM 17260 / SV96) TaxID=697282 RepID=G3ITI5_METTV|nr:fructosamine kinase family protein [Methylobacter tundripaludum]EGW21395.1 Fructosamine/Ketosamine-3-kinase [Methylobacter tundripaludum SV96]
MDWQAIVQHIESATRQPFKLLKAQPLSGGDINAAYRLQAENVSFFVKLNTPERLAMFEAEAAGLQALAHTQAIRVPKFIVCGQTTDHAFLVLEYIDLHNLNSRSEQLLGQQLAQLHRHKQAYFGWHRNNTIGSTIQINGRYHDWITFWQEQRLGHQLTLAAAKGYGGRLQTLGEKLRTNLKPLFSGYQPQPALVHGDLWGGNVAADEQGNPVIYDPACYFGDRETDLAMTGLFGGFSPAFYQAYQAVYPLDPGYTRRKTLYNLYHILNHLNLFGPSYLHQAENMLDKLLADL